MERRKFDFLDRLIFPIRENRAMDAVKSMKLDLYLLMFVSAEFHRDTLPIVQGPGSIPSQRGYRLSLRAPLIYILQGSFIFIENRETFGIDSSRLENENVSQKEQTRISLVRLGASSCCKLCTNSGY